MSIKVKRLTGEPEVDTKLKLPYYSRGFELTSNHSDLLTPVRAGTVNDYNAKKMIPNEITISPAVSIVQKSLRLNDVVGLTEDKIRNPILRNLEMQRKRMQHSTVTIAILQPTMFKYKLPKTKKTIFPAIDYIRKDILNAYEFYEQILSIVEDSGIKAIGFPYLKYFDSEQYFRLIEHFASMAANKGIDPIFFIDPADQTRFDYLLSHIIELQSSNSTQIVGIKYRRPKYVRNPLKLLQKKGKNDIPYLFINVPRDEESSLSGIHAQEVVGADIISIQQPNPYFPDEDEPSPTPDPFAFFKNELLVRRLSGIINDKIRLQQFLLEASQFPDNEFKAGLANAISKQENNKISSMLKVYEFITSSKEIDFSQNYIISNELKEYISSIKPLLLKWLMLQGKG